MILLVRIKHISNIFISLEEDLYMGAKFQRRNKHDNYGGFWSAIFGKKRTESFINKTAKMRCFLL